MSVGVLDEEAPYVTEDLTEEEAYLFAILSDESGLDQAEFLIYDPACEDNEIIVRNEDGTCARDDAGQVKREKVRPAPSGCFRAWDFQVWWWRNPEMYQIDQCARALDVRTPVPTPNGWTTMGELTPGSEVFDADGRPTLVTAVSEVWNDRDCYEVFFSDHSSIVADGDHLWETWDKKARAALNPKRRGVAKPRVVTTNEIRSTLRYGVEANHTVDVAGPLDVPEVDLPVDPYFLGYWLGDGNTNDSGITTADAWVLEELERRGIETTPRATGLYRYGVRYSRRHNQKTESVQAHLRRAGVLGSKHIPVAYLRSSERQRREVLAGLVDSDGHMQLNGSCEITQKSERLARDLLELLRSLGETPRVSKRRATLDGVDMGPVYRVTWRPQANPALMPRKAERFVRPREGGRLTQRRIIDVRPVPSRPVRCITVASERHLFLAGESMVPTHNSVGKSQSILVRGCAFPFVHPGLEMVVTAPELIHLEPIVSKIEQQFYATWFLSQMLPRGKSAVTHRPFQMNFLNGARIIGRIPQRDGKGVKGIHPIWLELDEAQDYPKAGWKELTETLKRGVAGARWRSHGVTRGVRDDFYEKTQDSSNWHVHRFPAMWRPNWTDKEREDAIAEYDSRDDPDYRRNVLGLHGDATNPIFVLTQLMKNVDNDPLSDYNAGEYFKQVIKAEELELLRVDITHFLDFPAGHLAYLGDATERKAVLDGRKQPRAIYWVGMDVGFTIDPSEILIFVEYREKPRDPVTKLRLLSRLSLWRMPVQQQVMAMLAVIDFYRPKVFALDRNGIGLPLWQLIQDHLDAFKARDLDKIPAWFHGFDLERAATSIKGYTFGQNLIVDFDKTIEVGRFDDAVEKAGMKREAKAYSTDQLRELVDQSRLWLPWDEDFLKQFQGATWTAVKGGIDQYGRRMFSKGNDHCLDAAREMALGWAQYSIEETIAAPKTRVPVYDSFVEM